MLSELRELWRYRELLLNLVRRDLKVRYKNSILGFLWSLVTPLAQVFVIWFVVRFFLGITDPNYSAYLFCGLIPWTFFQTALLDASNSVVWHYQILKKVYFPREILPLAAVIANLVHFLLAMSVFAAFMVVLRLPLRPSVVLFPVVLVVHTALVTGLAFYLACANVFFEDVKYMVSVLLQVLYWVCPVVYLVERVRDSDLSPALKIIYQLNPVAPILTAYRRTFLEPTFLNRVSVTPSGSIHPMSEDWLYFGIAAAVSVVTLVAGYAYFNRHKWDFAERA
jgi:lipopolysaccharide transport system permease protein